MSWFGNKKSVRKPNLAETLLALSSATSVARKNRLNDFVPVLVEHIVQEATTFAKTDRNPTTMDVRLLDLFYGATKVQSVVDRFLLGKTSIPLPTGEELNELVPAIKATLENPVRYGFSVTDGSGKLRIDWTTPVVPVELVEVKLEQKPDQKPESKDDPKPEIKPETKPETKPESKDDPKPAEPVQESEKKESS
jgi:hypothetical protein